LLKVLIVIGEDFADHVDKRAPVFVRSVDGDGGRVGCSSEN